MSWPDVEIPATDSALYDTLRELFGIGDYDDLGTGAPWHEARMHEIAKLKGQRNARKVSIRDLAITAAYCHHHGITILYPGQLYARIRAATTAHRNARSEAELRTTSADYDAAIDYEMTQTDSPWLPRLLRATGQAHRDHVLTEWRKARGR